ncbi:hypothetical protein, conserved [Eimeria tenella]|uniref:Uncharacterized protein n=1 Tax=Eimeria tenella TaxID=5802 RepID=U6KXF1_EIMTE|nr:hypothetical protein, conserved [Eimeria tenella]CDJ42837.1 hypothetical protein, conserved [Eimeria tenella]|eukprot:XP_013233587.1 hypothetical protein, conserved [Eimeria tenella]
MKTHGKIFASQTPQEGTDGPRLVDAEEFQMLKQIRDLKAAARQLYSVYCSLRAETTEREETLNEHRLQLMGAFDFW